MDEDARSELMSQYRERQSRQQKSSTYSSNRQLVNFTAQSYKKYDSVKIVNLVSTLQAHKLEPDVFAKEVQNYFTYHAERKQNVIDCLRDQVLV